MPALLNRTSMRPKRSMVASTASVTALSSRTSTAKVWASLPAARTSAASCSRSDELPNVYPGYASGRAMSSAAMRAPSRAKASAVARPCPCAAPVIRTTCPSKRPTSAFLFAVGFEVLVERDLERVVDHVGRDHEGTERRDRHHRFFVEELPHRSKDVIRDCERGLAEPAPIGHDRLLARVEHEVVGIFTGVDQDPAEKRAADETIGFGRNRVREDCC